jgi:hypothetical protein
MHKLKNIDLNARFQSCRNRNKFISFGCFLVLTLQQDNISKVICFKLLTLFSILKYNSVFFYEKMRVKPLKKYNRAIIFGRKWSEL